MGITILVILTGRAVKHAKLAADDALNTPSLAPSVADPKAGAWEPSVPTALVEEVKGLCWAIAKRRTPLPQAFERLERLASRHTPQDGCLLAPEKTAKGGKAAKAEVAAPEAALEAVSEAAPVIYHLKHTPEPSNWRPPDTLGAGMTDPFNATTTIDEARAVVAEQRNASLNASFDAATTNVQAPATSVSFGSSARRQNLPTLDRLTKTFGPVTKHQSPGKGIEYVAPLTDPSEPPQRSARARGKQPKVYSEAEKATERARLLAELKALDED